MNDELTTLASAYLDGDVSADERAQVEASAELLAEVDRLRSVRAVVSTTAAYDDAPISMRERHLAAALDAWDRLPDNERTGALRDSTPSGADRAAAAGVAAMSAPTRRSAKRRWTQSPGWLGAAAAGLVLVLAGGLVLRNTTSDDDTTDFSSADAGTTAENRSTDLATGAEEPADAAGSADAELEEATAAQAPAGAAPVEDGADVQIDLDAEAPPSDDGTLEQLNTLDDLVVFASDAIDAPESAELPEGATVITESPAATAEEADEIDLPLCQGADLVVGLAIYGAETVVVGIDQSRNSAVAYRQDDCSLVASASLD